MSLSAVLSGYVARLELNVSQSHYSKVCQVILTIRFISIYIVLRTVICLPLWVRMTVSLSVLQWMSYCKWLSFIIFHNKCWLFFRCRNHCSSGVMSRHVFLIVYCKYVIAKLFHINTLISRYPNLLSIVYSDCHYKKCIVKSLAFTMVIVIEIRTSITCCPIIQTW
jgi:hypothetical protein